MENENMQIAPRGPSEIIFRVDKDHWIMSIKATDNGPLIKFNTEQYPNCAADDFAIAVIQVLSQVGAIRSFLKESLSETEK